MGGKVTLIDDTLNVLLIFYGSVILGKKEWCYFFIFARQNAIRRYTYLETGCRSPIFSYEIFFFFFCFLTSQIFRKFTPYSQFYKRSEIIAPAYSMYIQITRNSTVKIIQRGRFPYAILWPMRTDQFKLCTTNT